jgi:hypothetical protein
MVFFTGSNIGILLLTFRLAKSLMVKYQIYLLSKLGQSAVKPLLDYFDGYV